MNSIKKTTAIIYIILSSYIAFIMIQPIQANPVMVPDNISFQFGIVPLDNNLHHVESIVELDVYDKKTYGNGTYWLYNNANTSCEVPIVFLSEDALSSSWYQDINISANGTEINFRTDWCLDLNESAMNLHSCLTSHIFNLTFNPYSSICLNIQWPFRSALERKDTEGSFDLTDEFVRMYCTGYTINGGKY